MSSTLRLAPSFLLAALLCALPASVARAEDASLPDDASAIVVGPDGMTLTDLLTAVSKASGQTILWGDQDRMVVGRRLRGPARIPVREGRFLETLQTLLAAHEIVLAPMGGKGARYWYAMDARMISQTVATRLKPEWTVVNEGNVEELEGRDGLFVSTVIPVENLDNLRDARTALQRLVTPNNIGSIQEVPSARAFLVTDFAPNVAAMWRALKQMDVATRAPGLRIESFRLEHAEAETVKALLLGLYPPRAMVPVPVQQAADMPLGGPYVVADGATNQVFVRASVPDLTAIAAVIKSVDVAPKSR
jgi:type II secretory pathway component GspD/PulD (secretin)